MAQGERARERRRWLDYILIFTEGKGVQRIFGYKQLVFFLEELVFQQVL